MNDVFVEVLKHLEGVDCIHLTQVSKNEREYLKNSHVWKEKNLTMNKEIIKHIQKPTEYATYVQYIRLQQKVRSWSREIRHYTHEYGSLFLCEKLDLSHKQLTHLPSGLWLPNAKHITLPYDIIYDLSEIQSCFPNATFVDKADHRGW